MNVLSESVKGAVALLTNTEERGEARLFLCKELAKMEAGGLKSLRQKLLQNIGTKKYEEEYWKFFQICSEAVNCQDLKEEYESVNWAKNMNNDIIPEEKSFAILQI